MISKSPYVSVTVENVSLGMSTADFMNRPAVSIDLAGRYSLASRYDPFGNRREFACRTSRVSPFQMLISVPVLGPIGERVIAYFGDFGCIDSRISDKTDGDLLLELQLPRERREKFASQLQWLDKQQKNGVLLDGRKQKRVVPKNPHSTLIFADGTTVTCLVIDISPSGVAVSADAEPEIGSRLAVGRAVGHVVRRFPEGFAVQFDRHQDAEALELVMRPPSDIFTYQADQMIVPRAQWISKAPAEPATFFVD